MKIIQKKETTPVYSRRIRLRAWNKKTKTFVYDPKIFDRPYYEYTEWTGLIDTNGKRVYEGDFIEWCFAIDIPELKEYGQGFVHFSSGVFYTGKIIEGNEKYFGLNTYQGFPLDANLAITVKGNIYLHESLKKLSAEPN